MCGVFPRTRLIPLGVLVGALTLLSACGTPPQPPLKSPPLASPSAAPLSLPPSALPGLPPATTGPTPATTPTLGAYPTYPAYTFPTYTYPGYTYPPYTPPATTASPSPTPSHAARCTGSPTGAQILAMIKDMNGIPKVKLQVDSGPYCSGDWSFTMVKVAGSNDDQLEPLAVVATGKDTTLTPVAVGSYVCTNRVLTTAPPGIRVLACGS
jgi:hypothetical protein